jgi:hypothetical protein
MKEPIPMQIESKISAESVTISMFLIINVFGYWC